MQRPRRALARTSSGPNGDRWPEAIGQLSNSKGKKPLIASVLVADDNACRGMRGVRAPFKGSCGMRPLLGTDRGLKALAGLKDKRGFIDKDRLDLSERKAVEYWMKRWGVTRDQITGAHRKAGLMIKDIAAELGKKR